MGLMRFSLRTLKQLFQERRSAVSELFHANPVCELGREISFDRKRAAKQQRQVCPSSSWSQKRLWIFVDWDHSSACPGRWERSAMTIRTYLSASHIFPSLHLVRASPRGRRLLPVSRS